jgi:hypothetical protein
LQYKKLLPQICIYILPYLIIINTFSIFLGVLGIKVKIMLPWDPNGKTGPKKPLPDNVSVVEPKDEIFPTVPMSDVKTSKPDAPPLPGSTPL